MAGNTESPRRPVAPSKFPLSETIASSSDPKEQTSLTPRIQTLMSKLNPKEADLIFAYFILAAGVSTLSGSIHRAITKEETKDFDFTWSEIREVGRIVCNEIRPLAGQPRGTCDFLGLLADHHATLVRLVEDFPEENKKENMNQVMKGPFFEGGEGVHEHERLMKKMRDIFEVLNPSETGGSKYLPIQLVDKRDAKWRD
ncbi:MAG: hypothetical protein L6R40_007908 [Gallowayella cf. fulva]|nr:MAG: hypothetical protein L6R40_007908 [Xanthomendoza cf. fulva]